MCYGHSMSKNQVDKYLASLEQPKRGTLEALRRTILEIIPEAEQCISYSMPAFRVQGKVIAGFAAFKNHLSYLPHSGSVFPKLGDALSKYKTSPGNSQSINPYPKHCKRSATRKSSQTAHRLSFPQPLSALRRPSELNPQLRDRLAAQRDEILKARRTCLKISGQNCVN